MARADRDTASRSSGARPAPAGRLPQGRSLNSATSSSSTSLIMCANTSMPALNRSLASSRTVACAATRISFLCASSMIAWYQVRCQLLDVAAAAVNPRLEECHPPRGQLTNVCAGALFGRDHVRRMPHVVWADFAKRRQPPTGGEEPRRVGVLALPGSRPAAGTASLRSRIP